MTNLYKLIGIFIYGIVKNINFRFFLPSFISNKIENMRMLGLKMQGSVIGRNSFIRNGCFIAYPKNLIIGSNVTLGQKSNIFNYSQVLIGDQTEIGPNLYIQTQEHIWADPKLPIGKQGAISEKIKIGAGVYIGANVSILKGVNIADNCIVAAGAVVVKSTEKGYIYGGVPAKKIKKIN